MEQELVEAIEGIYGEFSRNDSRGLRQVNDRCIELLGMGAGKEMLSLAIVSYVLSKILSKPRFFERRASREYLKRMREEIISCRAYARAGKDEETLGSIVGMLKMVEKLNMSDRRFFLGLEQKAKLKIAATLYAQGFSLGRASEITGMETREIMKYAGGSMMFDRVPEKLTMEERIRTVRKIFG